MNEVLWNMAWLKCRDYDYDDYDDVDVLSAWRRPVLSLRVLSSEFWVTQTIPGIPVLQKLMFVICDPSLGKQPSHHITSHHMQFQFRVIVILGFLGKQLVCANCAFTVHSEGKHNITHQVINFWNLEYVSMWDETWDMRHESWVMNRDSDDMRNFFQCPVTLWLWPDPVSRPMMVLTVLTAHPIPIN